MRRLRAESGGRASERDPPGNDERAARREWSQRSPGSIAKQPAERYDWGHELAPHPSFDRAVGGGNRACVLAAAPGGAQPGRDGGWAAPRTPWGDPDIQGLWNNATTTPLQRAEELGEKAFLSDEEVAERDLQVGAARNTDREPRAGDPGTYNEFWWERGRTAANNRTSLIFDPPNGRLPALSPDGERRSAAAAERRQQRGEYDSWTDRPLAERCIIYRGIPGFPTGYNNNYHISQTPDYVAIVQEHIHEIRLIPLDGRPHVSGRIRQWLGDSRGRWEGETLVVETTNFSEQSLLRNINGDPSESLHVIERYTRAGPGMIDYEFTVTDPVTWTQPWSGSLPLTAFEGPMYEYACHEGNYALGNVLAGARAQERDVQSAKGSSR